MLEQLCEVLAEGKWARPAESPVNARRMLSETGVPCTFLTSSSAFTCSSSIHPHSAEVLLVFDVFGKRDPFAQDFLICGGFQVECQRLLLQVRHP